MGSYNPLGSYLRRCEQSSPNPCSSLPRFLSVYFSSPHTTIPKSHSTATTPHIALSTTARNNETTPCQTPLDHPRQHPRAPLPNPVVPFDSSAPSFPKPETQILLPSSPSSLRSPTACPDPRPAAMPRPNHLRPRLRSGAGRAVCRARLLQDPRSEDPAPGCPLQGPRSIYPAVPGSCPGSAAACAVPLRRDLSAAPYRHGLLPVTSCRAALFPSRPRRLSVDRSSSVNHLSSTLPSTTHQNTSTRALTPSPHPTLISNVSRLGNPTVAGAPSPWTSSPDARRCCSILQSPLPPLHSELHTGSVQASSDEWSLKLDFCHFWGFS
jgi:hypothetical protein